MAGPAPAAVYVEADGGSRGNPGPAAYGAVLKDAASGNVIAEKAECIGVATNNVAEYRGLIAGLELHQKHTPQARLEVRMDSKLVVEQMSGRWKIKHPDMRPLALQASRLAPSGTTYTWIPRSRNADADALLNAALDAQAGKRPRETRSPSTPSPRIAAAAKSETVEAGGAADPPTTLVLVRHGATAHTHSKRFSGRGGADLALTEEGRAQVRAAADWLAPLGEQVSAMLTSPLRRARESAEIVGARLGVEAVVEEGLVEAGFGAWDGLTFAQVQQRFPEQLDAWLASTDAAPDGGTSLAELDRTVRRARDRILANHPGTCVVAVSHVTPIKLLVRLALGAPLESLYRMQLDPASVTVVSWFRDGNAALRLFNARPDAVNGSSAELGW